MQKEQALNLLIQVTAEINAPRAVHQQIMQAIEVLRKELMSPIPNQGPIKSALDAANPRKKD